MQALRRLRAAAPTRSLLVVGTILWLGIAASCGGSAEPQVAATSDTSASPLTTVFVPEAQVAPRTAPPPKPTTTTTTTTIVIPAGFPADLPLPAGAATGYYTGSPELGFHLNLSTATKLSELVEFFTVSIDEADAWRMSVRDLGQGFLPGYAEQWAVFTGPDHVVTQVFGEYTGAIEIMGRHVNILLDPLAQPEPGLEPDALPPFEDLPRPTTAIESVQYSTGLVQTVYTGVDGTYETLIDAYRELGWAETVVNAYGSISSSRVAVGELAGWKVTITDETGGGGAMRLKFEDLSLSFP